MSYNLLYFLKGRSFSVSHLEVQEVLAHPVWESHKDSLTQYMSLYFRSIKQQ